ncbi:MAG: GDP-mannose 4,6-dehydratase [Candidatus Andersenbacteria bacterium]
MSVDIIHQLRGRSAHRRSIRRPRAFLETDVLGTFTLLKAVRKHEITKYIQVSTDEVFGTTKDEFAEDHRWSPTRLLREQGRATCSAAPTPSPTRRR